MTKVSATTSAKDDHPLWELVAALEDSMPFRQKPLEDLLRLRFFLYHQDEFTDFLEGTDGIFLSVPVEHADLRIDKERDLGVAMFALDVAPQCVSVTDHFKNRPPSGVWVPSPEDATHTYYYSFDEPWGLLSFGVRAGETPAGTADCVVSILFDLRPQAKQL
jgi:hypothetical protein